MLANKCVIRVISLFLKSGSVTVIGLRCEYSRRRNSSQAHGRLRVAVPLSGSTGRAAHRHRRNPVTCERICKHVLLVGRTSLLMRTTNILRLMSVFIPCLFASFNRAFSSEFCLADARFKFSCASARGSPLHAAPTSHHLPLVSAERKSSKLIRSGSCGITGRRS